MLPVKVKGLSLSNMGFVVLLKSDQDERTLPILIGGGEAQSIAIHLDKVEIPRPLTHDLMKNLIDCVECRLKRVVVNDIVESTFYAVLVFERDGAEFEVDARPSDAVALALRCGAPMFVVRKVMDKGGILLQEADADGEKKAAASNEATAPTAMTRLQHELEQAVLHERFEDAARLRDEIRRLQKSHARN